MRRIGAAIELLRIFFVVFIISARINGGFRIQQNVAARGLVTSIRTEIKISAGGRGSRWSITVLVLLRF